MFELSDYSKTCLSRAASQILAAPGFLHQWLRPDRRYRAAILWQSVRSA